MSAEKVLLFIEQQVASTKHSKFYSELKDMVTHVQQGEIIEDFKKAKYIDYNKFSIIPIVYPLCVYYKRTGSIDWLLENVDYERCSSKDRLLANLIKLNLKEHVPKIWKTDKSPFPYLCDDMDVAIEFVENHRDSFENDMKDGCRSLDGTTIDLLRYFMEHGFLTNHDNTTIVEKFVILSDKKHYDKMKYILENIEFTSEDFLKIVNNSVICHEFLDLITRKIKENDLNDFLKKVIEIVSKRAHSESDGYDEDIDCIFYLTKRLK